MNQDELVMVIAMVNNNVDRDKLILFNIFAMDLLPLDIGLLMENKPHVRLPGFTDEWIGKYLDADFFGLFRMNKETFHIMWRKINGPEFQPMYFGGGIPIAGHTQLLMTLWWLGKGETLLSVSEKFNVAISTVFKSTNRVLDKIIGMKNIYIVWPKSAEELNTVENSFRAISGYPGVIGAIDCSNIPFKAPLVQQDSYIDKNGNHSIKLQGVRTASKIFTNINVGFLGSVHDSRVLKNSQLFVDIYANGNLRKFFPLDDYHVVGDRAYPLLKWLIKPYLGDDRHLSRQQKAHNKAHSKTRLVIEHTFGLLKGRWRILKYINVNSVEKAVKIIAACCVLHNFCYIYGDEWNEENIIEDNDNQFQANDDGRDNAGLQKRHIIAQIF